VDRPDLAGRCGTCARFVRVTETIDQNGEVRRAGECLLGVWPSPIYETSTCSQWVQRGAFVARPAKVERAPRRRTEPGARAPEANVPIEIQIPEELLDMDADEFRSVLRQVIRDELGVSRTEIGGRWEGGEVIIKPGREGTAEKRVPIDAFFHKIVMVRDKLRVLEQKINSHAALTTEDKVQMQQYITQCYGSLTTFNVLFANKDDQFVGQRGDKD
jgi:hypothetical protein